MKQRILGRALFWSPISRLLRRKIRAKGLWATPVMQDVIGCADLTPSERDQVSGGYQPSGPVY